MTLTVLTDNQCTRMNRKQLRKDLKLSPAAAFRNQYYLSQVNANKKDNQSDGTAKMPLNSGTLNYQTPSGSIKSLSDDEVENVSIKTIESDHATLFEPKSTDEPKIVLMPEESESKQDSNNSTLLSKLSKSTAPMRAKLSRSKTNFDHLWMSSSTTLSLPLRKSAEGVQNMTLARKKPTYHGIDIYPAFLSKVAYAFKEQVVVGKKTKNSIQYQEVFDGKHAVNKLASIIKSKDRNLAVQVGRALEYQKFFHDVNYEHRLRDSVNELYRFKDQPRPINKYDMDEVEDEGGGSVECQSKSNYAMKEKRAKKEQDNQLPNGIFTLLTNCYSPTCTPDSYCYSPICPRKIQKTNQNLLPEENEDRLWVKTVPESILKTISSKERKRQENIFELIYTEKDFVDDLVYVEQEWIQPLLSQDYIPLERRRDFANDVFWNLSEIRKNNASLLFDFIQQQQRYKVIPKIGNIFLKHVSKICEPFAEYGSHQIIGKYAFESEKATNTIFSEWVQANERAPKSRKLELNGYLTKPITRLGRYNLLLREILKHTNEDHSDYQTIPKVMQIISQFLTKVNEETGKVENRFGLELLEKKLLHNRKDNQSQEIDELELSAPERKIIMKGALKRKSNSANTSTESSELQVYVLDHCLLIIKSKCYENIEYYKLYKKPIPLALLSISMPDQTPRRSSSILPYNRSSTSSFHSATGSAEYLPSPLISYSSSSANSNSQKSGGYPISFIHLGRHGSGVTTLYASTLASRRKWIDTIDRHRQSVMEKSETFRMSIVSHHYFNSFNKVNCAVAFGTYIIFGCDQGICIKNNQQRIPRSGKHGDDLEEEDEEIVKVFSLEKVSQLDILKDLRLILVLADKVFYTLSLDLLFNDRDELAISSALLVNTNSLPTSPREKIKPFIVGKSPSNKLRHNSNSSTSSLYSSGNESATSLPIAPLSPKRLHFKKFGTNISFFRVGHVYDKTVNLERLLVCLVKCNSMTSTIRALEPQEGLAEKKKKKKKRQSSNLGLFMRHSNEVLRGFKDLYIPGEATSLQYFKNVICVGSAKGFQMVDIGSADVQSVLDPSDKNHEFINQRETLRPVSMFRHPEQCIMLCYNDLAFYIDKKGRRVRPDWLIHWEGHPTSFVLRYPYILAFDSSFIEIWHVNTGKLTQIITGHNIRFLDSESSESIYCVMDDTRTGNELILSLNYHA
ncbi:CNH domain-containing protein [Blakeslea trispora]|nr:CNH domain-containing protein [Blakeslea trispora]